MLLFNFIFVCILVSENLIFLYEQSLIWTHRWSSLIYCNICLKDYHTIAW
jgi:hypothetical protein